MSNLCPHCGQPMPEQARRDPPLPPLEKPAVVTIHDLPEGVEPEIEIVQPSGSWRLKPNREAGKAFG